VGGRGPRRPEGGDAGALPGAGRRLEPPRLGRRRPRAGDTAGTLVQRRARLRRAARRLARRRHAAPRPGQARAEGRPLRPRGPPRRAGRAGRRGGDERRHPLRRALRHAAGGRAVRRRRPRARARQRPEPLLPPRRAPRGRDRDPCPPAAHPLHPRGRPGLHGQGRRRAGRPAEGEVGRLRVQEPAGRLGRPAHRPRRPQGQARGRRDGRPRARELRRQPGSATAADVLALVEEVREEMRSRGVELELEWRLWGF